MAGDVMEAAVGILGEGEPGEQTRRLLAAPLVAILVFQVHPPVDAIDEGEFAGQSLAIEIAGHFCRLIASRQTARRGTQRPVGVVAVGIERSMSLQRRRSCRANLGSCPAFRACCCTKRSYDSTASATVASTLTLNVKPT